MEKNVLFIVNKVYNSEMILQYKDKQIINLMLKRLLDLLVFSRYVLALNK